MEEPIMKAVILGDPHAHKYKSFNQDNRRLKNVIRLIEECWDKAAELVVPPGKIQTETYPGLFMITGDLFNNHQTVATEAMVALVELFTRKSDEHSNVTVLLISGNHDQGTKNLIEKPAVSAIHALAELSDNVVCIDNGVYNGGDFNVYGIPYYPNKEDFREALKITGSVVGGNKNILLMHQTVGLDISMVEEDIDPTDELFNQIEFVFNGHIHTYKEVAARWVNVGTGMHRDAQDIGQEKGYLIFDIETMSYERVLTTGYPVFRHLPEDQPCPIEWEGDYIIPVPIPIAVAPEEEEIREKFDHTKVSREELLTNFIEIKAADKDEGMLKQINSYGQSLLRYVS